MIFTVRSKQVEIKATKRFRLLPGGDFSQPGHVLMNWLGLMVFISPTPPKLDAYPPRGGSMWRKHRFVGRTFVVSDSKLPACWNVEWSS